MVILFDSVIGGFGLVDLVWLTTSTVRLQVSDYGQLSDYSCIERLVKNKAVNAPITFKGNYNEYDYATCFMIV